MKKPKYLVIIISFLFCVGLLYNSLFIVNQTQQTLVFQFGEHVRTIKEPGLKIKIPFIQNLVYYDQRVLELDPKAEQLILADQKRLVVDTFLRYQISDPLQFYQAVKNELQAGSRLSDIVISALRRVLGNTTLATLLSSERTNIIVELKEAVDKESKEMGISITDVRIRRADLPEETSQAIYDRIRSEREREAKEFRAQGQELAQQIRARADRQKTVIIAEAEKNAQILRGNGDSEAIKIYADSFGKDPDFFSFYRSMEAYRNSCTNDTSMILSPQNDFLKYFGSLDSK